MQFQSGDVLGVYVENALDDASGVVLLNDIAAKMTKAMTPRRCGTVPTLT